MKIILILKTCKSKKIAIKKKGLNLIENKTYGAWNHKKKKSQTKQIEIKRMRTSFEI
jgi:hypothetical protein